MTYILELSPELEARARAQADAQNIDVEKLIVTVLEHNLPAPPPKPRTGAELVALLKEEGILGMWADREDMKDSTEYVRRLRQGIMDDVREKTQPKK